jgi:hypothetical protein
VSDMKPISSGWPSGCNQILNIQHRKDSQCLDTHQTRCLQVFSIDLTMHYGTYTLYNLVDVRSGILSNIMSSHYLHIYHILGLNGVLYRPLGMPPCHLK